MKRLAELLHRLGQTIGAESARLGGRERPGVRRRRGRYRADQLLDVGHAGAGLQALRIDGAEARLERLEQLGQHERVEAQVTLQGGVRRHLADGDAFHAGDGEAHRAHHGVVASASVAAIMRLGWPAPRRA